MTFLMLEDGSGAYELEDDSGGLLMDGDILTLLTLPNGMAWGYAYDTNGAVAVGEVADTNWDVEQAVLWDLATQAPTILGSIPDETWSYAGFIVGSTIFGVAFDTQSHEVIWDLNNPTDPPTVLPANGHETNHQNTVGSLVLGDYDYGNGYVQPIVWDLAALP